MEVAKQFPNASSTLGCVAALHAAWLCRSFFTAEFTLQAMLQINPICFDTDTRTVTSFKTADEMMNTFIKKHASRVSVVVKERQ